MDEAEMRKQCFIGRGGIEGRGGRRGLVGGGGGCGRVR